MARRASWLVARTWVSAGLVLLPMAGSMGCGALLPGAGGAQESSLETVDLTVTPVDNQGRFGICWSYGAVGLVESEAKKASGESFNLSEESVAFYFLAEMIWLTIQDSKGSFARFFELTSRGFNEGFFARIPHDKKKPGQRDALDLIEHYGLVPEASWSFKITSVEQRSNLMRALRTNAIRYLNGRDLDAVTIDDIIKNIMVGEGAFPSAPPTSISHGGKSMSAVAFVANILRFQPQNFVALEVGSEAELDPWILAVKRALSSGFTVPFGFPINVERIRGNTFGSDGVSLDDPAAFAADGGHLVLVTDFVNLGGREGAMPEAEVQAEVSRPSSDLDYLRFKNSWGVGAKTDADGRPVSMSPDGYYRLSRGYLVGAARAAEKGYLPLNAVVPKAALAP